MYKIWVKNHIYLIWFLGQTKTFVKNLNQQFLTFIPNTFKLLNNY